MKRALFPLVLTLTCLASASVQAARQPTELEQYMLELTNRARNNPAAEVALHSGQTWGDTGSPAVPDLNEGLAPGTISSSSKQPLAFDLDINQAAFDYADLLISVNQFTHTYGGTSASSRLAAAGYNLSPAPAGVTENIALSLFTSPQPITQNRIDIQHAGFFVDGDVTGRGHRINLLGPQWTSVGIGSDSGPFTGYAPYDESIMTVQDFARRNENHFLTGVAFWDVDLNNFYSPGIGESIGGYSIDAFQSGTSNLVGSTTTFSTGGYSLQLPAGNYDLRITGSGVLEWRQGINFAGDENLKIDFIDPGFIPIPEPSSALSALLAAGLLLARRRR